MAAEAEAAREARAKVIAAEGEQRASKSLKQAADIMMDSPAALQLRYLQTLNSIAGEKNSTIIFPVKFFLICSTTTKRMFLEIFRFLIFFCRFLWNFFMDLFIIIINNNNRLKSIQHDRPLSLIHIAKYLL